MIHVSCCPLVLAFTESKRVGRVYIRDVTFTQESFLSISLRTVYVC